MNHDKNNWTTNEFDPKYGVRLETETEALMIGDPREGLIVVNYLKNRLYRESQGLYESLFKEDPNHFSEGVVQSYGQFVKKTKALKRHY